MRTIRHWLAFALTLSMVLGPATRAAAEPPEARVTEPLAASSAAALVAHAGPDLTIEMINAATAAADESQRREQELNAWFAAVNLFLASLAPAPRVAAPARTQEGWPGCHAPNVSDTDEMRGLVRRAAEVYGVDPEQLLRIPPRESGWNKDTQNCSSGACGLFQHLPGYWPRRAEAVGYPGASCQDPWVNALAAAMMFKATGFSPWAPSGPY